MRAVDAAVVHTAAERTALAALPIGRVRRGAPPAPARRAASRAARARVNRRRLFFGKVRRYKGVDLLLQALTGSPTWPDRRRRDVPDAAVVPALVDRLGLRDRVDFRPATCRRPDPRPVRLGRRARAALPHRDGVPARRTGPPTRAPRGRHPGRQLPGTIHDGVDGLLLRARRRRRPDPGPARAVHPGPAGGAARGGPVPDDEQVWKTYLETLLMPATAREGRRPRLGG